MPLDPQELAALPLFADATPAMIDALARRALDVKFAANDVLFLTGAQPRGWFIVLDGEVRVVRGTGGRQHVIHTEQRGGTLGEVPLVEGGTHPATAIAARNTRCALFTRDALESAIAEQPRLAFLLARRLAARTRALVERLDERSARTVDARLLEFLRGRAREAGSPIATVGMTQSALAEELGTVREVVARAMRGLVRRGAIERVGEGRYRVADARGNDLTHD